MLVSRNKVISKTIFPIFVGASISILLHLGLPYLCSVLFPAFIESFDTIIFTLIFYIIPAMVGGFIATYLSAKKSFIHSVLTAIIFTIAILIPEITGAMIELNDLRLGDTFFLLMFLVIILAAMLGGYIGFRIKRRKTIS